MTEENARKYAIARKIPIEFVLRFSAEWERAIAPLRKYDLDHVKLTCSRVKEEEYI